ncbi:hypothetical protein PFICI_02939 [Pestalotiopsis fici W106-1]|uniref:FAD dependent oxidoreductase domain-containing protein n=1 Tax=Pestalotiopsis fici (strain W106-1 / CGMCC3.15140) TaxID=1229662 RepID=W3XFY0_PESFW|nr:uncharacterized protein PFICI_02939 [Pestalotiopsis fici W106-1]ETS84914.1 hypothetical protein PFICI_02939 [Pestalotiopsis fici W106-1]
MAPQATNSAPIVVIGAGVIGLTTALSLCRAGYTNVKVIAKHMPADFETEYTSKWAGADWVPFSSRGTREMRWDLESWNELSKLARTTPGAGVHFQGKTKYYRNKDLQATELDLWFKDVVHDYKLLAKNEVPAWADWATFYRTLTIDPSIYLHWLQSTCIELGVQFKRASLAHIREAFSMVSPEPALVVNCTSLQASKLGGVEDKWLKPMLGQLVIVENDVDGIYGLSGDDDMDASLGECCYVIPRPGGGGTAIGGCSYASSSKDPDMRLAERMMKRAVSIAPGLVPKGAGIEALRVIRHQVGWRPHRENGPRVEQETISDHQFGQLHVVHAYGLGGFGFQSSYGVAAEVVDLVGSCLSAREDGSSRQI